MIWKFKWNAIPYRTGCRARQSFPTRIVIAHKTVKSNAAVLSCKKKTHGKCRIDAQGQLVLWCFFRPYTYNIQCPCQALTQIRVQLRGVCNVYTHIIRPECNQRWVISLSLSNSCYMTLTFSLALKLNFSHFLCKPFSSSSRTTCNWFDTNRHKNSFDWMIWLFDIHLLHTHSHTHSNNILRQHQHHHHLQIQQQHQTLIERKYEND